MRISSGSSQRASDPTDANPLRGEMSLSTSVRRVFHHHRPPIFIAVVAGSVSTADGSALVRMGSTIVVCGVKAEIAEPALDAPDVGFVGAFPRRRSPTPTKRLNPQTVPNIDLPAICSPKFKPGPPSEEAQVLSERLNDALLRSVPPRSVPCLRPDEFASRSNLLSLDTLCISSGRAAWCLYIDTTCLNYDGNAFDAALIAIMAALQNSAYPFLATLSPN